MNMPEKFNEERAAEIVLGWGEEGRERPAESGPETAAAVRRIEGEMRETATALREWGRRLEAEPVRVPQIRSRS